MFDFEAKFMKAIVKWGTLSICRIIVLEFEDGEIDIAIGQEIASCEGDCSEGTGLPPEDVYRTVRVRTIEPGGPHNVWSRGIPPRSKRRDHRTRRPAPARDRPLQSQRPPATVSTLWVLGLSGQAVSSDAA